MKIPTIGILGKTQLDLQQEALLIHLGRIIATAGKELILVPAKGTAEAVQFGAESRGGVVREIERDVLGQSAHCIVFADDRLLTRLREIDPNIITKRNVTLLSTTLEIELWLRAADTVLREKGLTLDP